MVLNNTCECMPTLHKNAYRLVHARLCNGAAASLSWKLLRTYLESCANIVQAVSYRPPSCRPPSCRQSVARRCSLWKSVQIHASSLRSRRCGVAQASSDHLRLCRPHPVCLWVALALGHGGHFIKISNSAIFSREIVYKRKGNGSRKLFLYKPQTTF